ncbi:hypothetical protein OHS58_09620 [Amycolatopsis sp. NBC_00348]|uniref:MmyB family transcriptional regulator n=1 Tax=Amycolatopsis sp. NBC_00348 TaxID=2975956 RepID=UPI002E2710D6
MLDGDGLPVRRLVRMLASPRIEVVRRVLGEASPRWARHDVRARTTGSERLHHPVAGPLELTFEVLMPAADEDQALVVYGAEPGSASEDGLRLPADRAASRPDSRSPAT